LKIINLTPHEIVVRLDGQPERRFAPEATPARVEVWTNPALDVDGIPCVTRRYGAVTGLPSEQVGVVYLVSPLVAAAARREGRRDVFVPDTSPDSVVRDAVGRIVGVRRLAME